MNPLLIAAWYFAPIFSPTSGTYYPTPDLVVQEQSDISEILYAPSQPANTQTSEFCFPVGGHFNIEVHMQMALSGDAGGSLKFQSMIDESHSKFITSWKSYSTQYSELNNSSITFITWPGECFRLLYYSTGYAQVNTDQRVTYVVVRKL